MRRPLVGAATCLLLLGCGTTGPSAPAGGAGTTGGMHQSTDGLDGNSTVMMMTNGGGTAGAGGAGGSAGGAGTSGTAGAGAGGMIGNWLYASGTTTRTCPGETGTDAAPEGALSIAAGATASALVVSEPGACALQFSLAAVVATAAAGQTCSGSDGAGGVITFSNMTWTLSLSADGATLAESLSADETLAPASGPARTCRYTETGVTLRRM